MPSPIEEVQIGGDNIMMSRDGLTDWEQTKWRGKWRRYVVFVGNDEGSELSEEV